MILSRLRNYRNRTGQPMIISQGAMSPLEGILPQPDQEHHIEELKEDVAPMATRKAVVRISGAGAKETTGTRINAEVTAL